MTATNDNTKVEVVSIMETWTPVWQVALAKKTKGVTVTNDNTILVKDMTKSCFAT